MSRPFRSTTAQATNFYYSFVFLPRKKRCALEAVYAFARCADDVADGGLAPEESRRQIARYRRALEACYAPSGNPAGELAEPGLRALAESVRAFKISRRHFEDLILGLEMDLNGVGYETFEELALYCYRVAGTVGLISIEIFGYQDPRARDYAVNLGIALQLVNILRDLKSDARNGRVYLPREDLERFGVRPDRLAAGCYNDPFVELMEFECDRARRYFGLARDALPPRDRRSLIAAEIMGAIYWRLLRRIQQRRYDVFRDPVRLSSPLKFWTALSVYLGADWHR